MRLILTAFCLLLLAVTTTSSHALEISNSAHSSAFPLVDKDVAATLLVDPDEPDVVKEVAAIAFAQDVQRVTGIKPQLQLVNAWNISRPTVIIGTLGHSDLIKKFVDEGALDVSDLQGQWESFKLAQIHSDDTPGADVLVIVGSDRRGTAYGVFELSRAIGVSPWYWWADVPVKQHEQLHITTDGHRIGPPTVKYRGIFLNDEDWGLQPWAAKTYEPETGDIGPKTYAAIFELLLRLKANYIWPAMHPSTRAFNYYSDNKIVADRYAIIMGSSHAEPMLRNNVDEWARDGSGDWNYVTNREAVLKYWDERVRQNGQYENIYTIGMRGIHDSSMVGGGSIQDRVNRMHDIFAQQRKMLQRHIGKPAEQIPQVFVPYKEVLAIYNAGLEVPQDVIMGWVDDNFGYIRKLSNAEERKRSGGAGVYYHISYWGQPHDYLWIESTPPGLIWEEMTKAREYGADRLWVNNVGDIKPCELGMDWFLRLAWDTDRYGPTDAHRGLVDFFRESFGDEHAEAMADVMTEYYQLNHPRKPEFMGWSTVYPTTGVRDSDLSHWAHGDEAQRRVDAFDALQARAEAIGEQLPEIYHDAYFELVIYPVQGAADMNRKHIYAEKSRFLAQHNWPAANEYAQLSHEANERIKQSTRRYNEELAGGKWRGMMSMDPRGLAVFQMPPVGTVKTTSTPGLAVRVEGKSIPAVATNSEPSTSDRVPQPVRLDAGKAKINGKLERVDTPKGPAITLADDGTDRVQQANGPSRAAFNFKVATAGKYTLRLEVMHLNDNADSWHIAIDHNEPITWNDNQTGEAWQWFDVTEATMSAGSHQVTVIAREDGAQLRAIALVPANTPAALADLALTDQPNQLPVLNRYTQREAFIDLYNTGNGSARWKAEASESWVELTQSEGDVETHQRIRVAVDFGRAPRQDHLTATIVLHGPNSHYRLKLPIENPDVDIMPGTFIRENNVVSIDAEHFQDNVPGAGNITWRIIDGVGYSGVCVGLFPRLVPEEVKLVAGTNAPTITYPLYLSEGGSATVTLQALPTHEITEDHSLVCAISIDDGQPQMLSFKHGNHERDGVWKHNILRNAMTASTTVLIPKGTHTLTIYGIDPSIVLDRISITFGNAAPAYQGPRETRVSTPTQS